MSKRFKSALRGSFVAIFLIAVSSLQAADDRNETLGRGMRCMCGTCQQLLSECNHLGCPSAEPMRKELKSYIDQGEDDKTILASFKAKYGPKVLSAPPTDDWFNLSAWLMPFVAFAAGAIAVIYSLKKIRTSGAEQATPAAPTPDTSAYDKEIEEELQKYTPED